MPGPHRGRPGARHAAQRMGAAPRDDVPGRELGQVRLHVSFEKELSRFELDRVHADRLILVLGLFELAGTPWRICSWCSSASAVHTSGLFLLSLGFVVIRICRHSLEDLQLVAECIGGPGLAQVCRLLAQDHGGWSGMLKVRGSRFGWHLKQVPACLLPCSSFFYRAFNILPAPLSFASPASLSCSSCALTGGMPDLLLWHAGRRAAKLSEVKGPRDRLSDQQRAWMAALSGGRRCYRRRGRMAWHLLCWVLAACCCKARCPRHSCPRHRWLHETACAEAARLFI